MTGAQLAGDSVDASGRSAEDREGSEVEGQRCLAVAAIERVPQLVDPGGTRLPGLVGQRIDQLGRPVARGERCLGRKGHLLDEPERVIESEDARSGQGRVPPRRAGQHDDDLVVVGDPLGVEQPAEKDEWPAVRWAQVDVRVEVRGRVELGQRWQASRRSQLVGAAHPGMAGRERPE